MSIVPMISLEDLTEYHRRVGVVREKFASLGRGANSRAAQECFLSPSRVSNILGCRYYDLQALELLEIWANEAVKTVSV